MCRIDDDEYLNSLKSRIEYFTEFFTKTTERFQIVNYGLGGHCTSYYNSFNIGVRKKMINLKYDF